MITQELLDYVNAQLSGGFTREQITSDLLAQGGWTGEQINEAFHSLDSGLQQYATSVSSSVNKYWNKYIYYTNKLLMGLSLLLFVVLDTGILIASLELFPFWAVMAAVMLVFAGFYRYENSILKERFANSYSELDILFLILILLRNLVFVLNFIPVIQIIGLIALVFGGVPYLIIYYLTLRARNKSAAVV